MTQINLAEKPATFAEHWQPRMVAGEEVHVLLIEPRGTPNTGDRSTAQARRVV